MFYGEGWTVHGSTPEENNKPPNKTIITKVTFEGQVFLFQETSNFRYEFVEPIFKHMCNNPCFTILSSNDEKLALIFCFQCVNIIKENTRALCSSQ